MDLCVTHTWAFLLAPTHELTLSYHLFIVKREDWPAISLSCLHSTPKYHVCSHTTNLDRQTNTVIHCFAWLLIIFCFKDNCVCILLLLIKINSILYVSAFPYILWLLSKYMNYYSKFYCICVILWVFQLNKKFKVSIWLDKFNGCITVKLPAQL